MRRERFFIQVTYDTPREKLEQLAAEIKRLIADHPLTNKKNFHVRFNDLERVASTFWSISISRCQILLPNWRHERRFYWRSWISQNGWT
jgi:hypothetical protein